MNEQQDVLYETVLLNPNVELVPAGENLRVTELVISGVKEVVTKSVGIVIRVVPYAATAIIQAIENDKGKKVQLTERRLDGPRGDIAEVLGVELIKDQQ